VTTTSVPVPGAAKLAVLRWAIPLAAGAVLGPIAAWLAGTVRAVDGGHAATLLVSDSPVVGVAALAGVGVLALAGAGAARIVGPRLGLFTAGIVLAWGAGGVGRVDSALATAAGNGVVPGAIVPRLVLEGLLAAILAGVLAIVVLRAGRSFRETRPGREEPAPARSEIFAGAAPLALAGALAACSLAVWFLSRDGPKGQTLAAGIIGGVLSGLVGRMISGSASAALFVVVGGVLAVVGPLAGVVAHGGNAGLVTGAIDGGLFPLARLGALDWIAGAFVGVPVGLAWAASMVEKHGQPA
jgi:hypothetical protein